jgi:hypothetical protein
MGLSFVIVDNLDVISITLPKFEANAPPRIYGHGPLTLPLAPEFVEADALERTQILKRTGDI